MSISSNQTRFALVSVVVLVTTVASFAQQDERPKLKHFGKSIKNLEWDPDRNEAVEKKRVAKKSSNLTDEDVVRVETSLVVCDLLVLDEQGQVVHGLSENDFVLSEDGTPQQVGMFSLGDNIAIPRQIVLVFDYSPSQVHFLKNSVAAASVLVEKLGPLDQMAIVTDDIELMVDFTKDKKKLKSALEKLGNSPPARAGQSRQYTSLMATLKEVFNFEDERPIVIFQTDGDELYFLRNWRSATIPHGLPAELRREFQEHFAMLRNLQVGWDLAFSLNDISTAALKSRATIYTVIPGVRLSGLNFEEQMTRLLAQRRWFVPYTRRGGFVARDLLAKEGPEAMKFRIGQAAELQDALSWLATVSGGWTQFLERPEQADSIYSSILSDINNRYLVGYYPTNKEHDGKRRQIKFEVRGHPKYRIIGRRSYFAPGPNQ